MGRFRDLSTIHPGVVTVTKDASCTSNFVFYDAQHHAYLGQAAHCSGTGGPSETNGCNSKSLPLGTAVELGETKIMGELVYNSWLAMQKLGEKNDDTCSSNDFALVRIPDSALNQVNPSIPLFGGPTGLRETPLPSGETVLSYGNSPLRGGITYLSPKQGVSLGTDPSGWEHTVYTLSPGVPGDSGSGFIDSEGKAFGVLSTLAIAPLPGSNGVADLAILPEVRPGALRYRRAHPGQGHHHLRPGLGAGAGRVHRRGEEHQPQLRFPRVTARRGMSPPGVRHSEDYAEVVLAVVEAIPAGRVMSYGDIADFLGAGGPRQVGSVLSREGAAVSWWRVVHADGPAAGQGRARARREWVAERTPLRPSGRVDMACRWVRARQVRRAEAGRRIVGGG